ncbi:MAG: hypothetical protein IPF46_10695 [Saprospiraceae bacterium]|nr:hypothetical protein [Candidatus Vicinibacter affinis]MBK6571649.1 hypothetical protein [Candidatus Vicinibacter affinis]MBK7799603.1 hypothetical protein [Candidatus Vicinibacter affinis]MBK8643863.1 hypothetical protein [Candidatus Vicinibacter affinis]MBP6172190.1 hypothetical protein [Saprospiraceae bacterium]
MNQSFTEILSTEIAKLLSPLLLLDSKEEIQELLKELGYDVDLNDISPGTDFTSVIQKIIALFDRIADLPNASDKQAELIAIGIDLGVIVKEVSTQIVTPLKNLLSSISGISNKDELPKRLGDYLVYTYFEEHYKAIFATKHLLGLLEEVEDTTNNSIKTVQWNLIGKLFSKPIDVFDQVYDWSNDFGDDKFLKRFEKLVLAFGLPGGIYEQTTTIQAHLGNPVGTKEVRMPVYQDGVWPDNWRELDINVSPIPANASDKKGLFLYPYFFGGVSISDDINPNWKFELEGDTDIGSGLGLGIRPPAKLNVVAGWSGLLDTTNLKLKLIVTRKQNGDKIYLFGNPDATHLSLAGVVMEVFVEKIDTKKKDFGADLKLQKLRFELKKGEGDGFINKILPENGMNAEFDVQLGYSLEKGFYFKGSGTFGIEIPLHLILGPLEIKALKLGFDPKDEGLGLDVGTSFELKLGPITAVVENIGLSNLLSFPNGNSNEFSLADIKVAFKPPNGIGINIDTDAVSGGGYLYINAEEGRYAGVAGLSIKDKIKLSAFGLINTKFPDGRKGYSFLIFISAEFPPIQLGYGFTLNGVGGLVGIHRTIIVEELRKGVKTGAYDNLLFPENPVENALEIIASLEAIFPVSEGRYVFGIMGKIGWGAPTLITIDLGLIIEVPNPVKLAILGVVKAILPTEDKAILKLQVNFLGVIDFGKKQLSFDATIYDSRLLTFSLAGDMAMRLSWGSNSNFLMSVGGFHPSYQPPPQLISMNRLTLNLLGGDNPRLTLTCYFAVTSNTVQFGSKVDLYVKVASKLTAEGYLGFDALFQMDPFYMKILAAAYLAIKWNGDEKMAISLSAVLEGPKPWNVDGVAEVKVLCIKYTVKVQKTWGQSQYASLPAVTVANKLNAALNDLKNWRSELTSGKQQLVTLRKIVEGDNESIMLPEGVLVISQKVLPMNINIQLFGTQEVSDGGQYAIGDISINGNVEASKTYVKEDFVPAHFRKMSETEKLSGPSFQKYDGGIRVDGMNNLIGSTFESKIIEYETIIYNPLENSTSTGLKITENNKIHEAMVKGSKAGQSSLSVSKNFAPLAPKSITVLEEEYGVVKIEDLTLIEAGALCASFTEAQDYYLEKVSLDLTLKNKLKIIPKFEIQTA